MLARVSLKDGPAVIAFDGSSAARVVHDASDSD
jgi:hypothetical protein